MKALSYIEIDIPFCANIYGTAPCTAAIPTTGEIKCFNTPNTCQDRENYIDAPVTLRFSDDRGFLPREIECIPSVRQISFTPATVSLGKDLGTRASLTVTFLDHPWPDTGQGFDKYFRERNYDPVKQGTFWGKFRARQPFLRGRAMRLIRGFDGEDLADMETHHFLIDSFSYSASDGTFQIVAKDVLKLVDDDRSQAPRMSQGFLVADMTDTDRTLTLSPAGIGNSEYPPREGYVAIGGKEAIYFKRDETAGIDSHAKFYATLTQSPAPLLDSSSGAKTISISGSVTPFAGGAVFGGGHLFLSDHADWTQAGDFTFETNLRLGTLAALQTVFQHATDANNRYALEINTNGSLTFKIISAGVTILTMSSAAGAVVALGQGFYHIVVMRTGNVWEIDLDGVRVATVTQATAIPNFTSLFRIGANQSGTAALTSNAQMYSFRLSDVARFVAPFTPPIQGALYQTSSDILYGINRGQLNTEATSHDAQDRVQVILSYAAMDAADIIRDLMVTYAGVPDAYIPLESWKLETTTYLNRVFTADIAEPTGVRQLIAELIEDAALSIWWDDVNAQIKLRVLRSVSSAEFTFDQSTYLEKTFASREQPNERVSQVWRYFAKRNPCDAQDNADNYRSCAVEVDLEAETDYGSPAIKKIFSRWMPFGGRSIADKANEIYLSRFRNPPRRFTFSSFRNGLVTPVIGQGYQIEGMGLQDAQGEAVAVPFLITRLNPLEAQFDIEAEEMLQAGGELDNINRVIVIDANTTNVNLRTLHDTLYLPPTDQDVIDGVNLTCYVDGGVTVSSTNSALAAFLIGDGWPAGFPITLVVTGTIAGAGGRGGSCSTSLTIASGTTGGTAIYTRTPITLARPGNIWAGGGGGGAGRMVQQTNQNNTVFIGDGGGGGAGQIGGAGGIAGTANGTHGDDGDAGTATTGGAGGSGSGQNSGGAGGGRGAAGSNGLDNHGGVVPITVTGLGGAGGLSIDGFSYCTVTDATGSLMGATAN